MATRVMVMAGGTGGHVFPALAVANDLLDRGCEVTWLGTPDSFESRVVPQHGIALDTIAAYRLRGQGLLGRVLGPLRLLRAMWQASKVIRRRKPQVLLGMGGFASGPGGLVARLTGRPLVIHEQNAIPGMTNRWLSRMATRTLQAFPNSFVGSDIEVTGNPVRRDIASLEAPAARFAARGGSRLNVLVMGGSLGAQALNETLPKALALLPESLCPRVFHQTGRGKQQETEQAYAALGIEAQISEFIEDMPAAYADADLVICRSGALTVSELATVGVASVLVPYPYAVDDHQTANGAMLVAAGAAEMVQQKDLTPELLVDMLQLLLDREHLLTMAESARRCARADAEKRVADICLEVAA